MNTERDQDRTFEGPFEPNDVAGHAIFAPISTPHESVSAAQEGAQADPAPKADES